MGNERKKNLSYTRGGQILSNNWRMLFQVNKQVLHLTLALSALLMCAFVWCVAPQDSIQSSYYYVLSFILCKLWMPHHVFRYMWHSQPVIASAHSLATSDYIIGQFDVFLGYLKAGAVVGSTFGFISMLLFRWILIKRGEEQNADTFIRGSQIAKPSEFTKAVRRSESGPSDIEISGIPMVRNFEVKHTLIHGTTGSGKGQTFNQFIEQIRSRGESAIVFDKGCVFTGLFHNEKTDAILNPFDTRCAKWDLWSEARSAPDFDNIAESLIPMHGDSDPYWVDAARTVFSSAAYRMKDDPDRSIDKLLALILTAELDDLSEYLEGTQAATLVSGKIEKTAISIRSVISTYLKSLRFLKGLEATGRDGFCIRDWVKSVADVRESHFLFISSNAEHHASLRPLISMWLSMANITLMSLHEDFDRRIWFICDELPSLHKLPQLGETIAEIRKFGGCFVLGMQSYSQLRKVYGQSGASEIFDLLNTRFFFRSPSSSMAEMVSQELGKEEVEQTNESYSYGSNTIRDGISIGSHTVTRPLVSPSEVMDLPDMQAYVRVPEQVPITKIKIKYKMRTKSSRPFLLRDIPEDQFSLKEVNKPSLVEDSSDELADSIPNPVISEDNPTNIVEKKGIQTEKMNDLRKRVHHENESILDSNKDKGREEFYYF